MEILTIVVGLTGLAIGVMILKQLKRIQRLLEQPVARKMPQEMKVRLGMRSQRNAQQRGGESARNEDGQKGESNRNDRNERNRNRNERNRNERNRNRNRNDRDQQGKGNNQRRRNRFEAPSEVLGNDVEAEPDQAENSKAQEQSRPAQREQSNSNRPPLAPRGGDRQAESAVAENSNSKPETASAEAVSAPAAPQFDAVRFGRRTVVKRSPELDDEE